MSTTDLKATAPTDGSFGEMTARRIIFYGVFVFLVALYLLIVPTFIFGYNSVSISTMGLIAVMKPIVETDIPFVGDLVPAILGAIIGGTAPKTANLKQLGIILVVAIITYILYVHMTAFFSTDADGLANNDLDVLLTQNGISAATLQALANSSRNFTVFVISTLIGIRFNASSLIQIPLQSPAQDRQHVNDKSGPQVAAEGGRAADNTAGDQGLALDPSIPKQDERNEGQSDAIKIVQANG